MKKLTMLKGFVCVLCICFNSKAYATDPKDETPQINFNDSLFVSGSSKDGATSFSINNDKKNDENFPWLMNFNVALSSKNKDEKSKSEKFLDFNKISSSLYLGHNTIWFYCEDNDKTKAISDIVISYKSKISTDLINRFISVANEYKSTCFNNRSALLADDSDYGYAKKITYIVNNIIYNASVSQVKEWCKSGGLSDDQCKLILSSKGFIEIKDPYGFSPLSSIVLGFGIYGKYEQFDKSILFQIDDVTPVNVSDVRDETFRKFGGGVYGLVKGEWGMLSIRGFLDHGKRFEDKDFKNAKLCENVPSSSSNSVIENCKDVSIYKGNFDDLNSDIGYGYNISYSIVMNPSELTLKVSNFEDFLEKKANYNFGTELRFWGDNIEKNHARLSLFITPGFADNPLSGRLGFSVDYKFEDQSVTPYVYIGGAVF